MSDVEGVNVDINFSDFLRLFGCNFNLSDSTLNDMADLMSVRGESLKVCVRSML